MKVLYLHQYFSTPKGKTANRSYQFARALIARNHQVTMVCVSSDMSDTGLTSAVEHGVRRGNVDGIDVIEVCLPYSNYDGLIKRSITFLRFAAKSIWIALREHYDLLYATSTPLTASIPGIAMRLAKPRHKFIFEVRDLWPELPRAMGVIKNPLVLGAMSALEKILYLAMHAGVALSPGIQQGMQRRSSTRKPIMMIPNGCDLEIFRPQKKSQDGISALPANFPRNGLRCVFIGAHGTANGLDSVLDGAEILRARGRLDIHLIFIGDGKLKPSLVARCRRDGFVNCHFLDPIPKNQLGAVLNETDVGLMILANVPAFYYGTSPNKFFDYISAGLPVLNNYPGWLAELICEHGCGIVVPPDDPESFAKALMKLADEPRSRQEMGQSARRLAETMFDRQKLGKQFVDFLEQVVAS